MFWSLSLSYEEVLVQHFLSEALNLRVAGTALWCKPVRSSVLSSDLVDDFFPVDTSHGVFIVAHIAFGWIEVVAAALSNYLEAKNFRFVMINLGRQDYSLRVMFQKVMWKACSKKCAINVDRPELRNVNLFAPWTVNFEARHFQAVTEADWQHLLSIAKRSWAMTIQALQEFMVDLSQADA